MDLIELLTALQRGEDSAQQFKSTFTNSESLTAELVAFSNSGGGRILIGVNDDGKIAGLSSSEVRRLNQLLSNAASQQVHPPLNPRTETILTAEGIVMVVNIPVGANKPYMDNSGRVWVKSGADKRHVTSREEMQRMFQAARLVHGDEVPVPGLTLADVDVDYFRAFFERRFGDPQWDNVSLPDLLRNMNLVREGALNVSGALLFARQPSFYLPAFIVKAVAYPGEVASDRYLDSRDITGRIADQFSQSKSFLLGHLRREQGEQSVNSLGLLEIPEIALEELLVNALLHRDYFISAPVRLFIFSDRVEIISPGTLPNNLTVENVKIGNSNTRNPILASFATHLLPYRGIGTGIPRALREYPHIDLVNDTASGVFKVIVHRQALPAS